MFHSKLKPILWVMAFVLVLAASWHVRMYPLRMHVSSGTYDQAALVVVAKIKVKVFQSVQQQHPQLSPKEQQALAQKQVDEIIRDDSERIKKHIFKLNQTMTASKADGEYKPYLLGSDSYYFLWLTNNVIETGVISPTVKGSRFYADDMAAPVGQWEPFTLHPYVGYWVWRVASIFNKDISVMEAVAYTPMVLVSLCLLAFFVACRMMGCGVLSTTVSAAFLMMAAIFLKRSTYAWYDSDPYNVLFPILCAACFFYAILAPTVIRRRIGVVLLGIVSVVYSFFWQGWIFTPVVLGLGLVAIAVYNAVIKRTLTGVRRQGLALALLSVTILIGLVVMYGWEQIMFLVNEAVGGVQLLLTSQTISLWPDLFVGVGELKKSDSQYIIDFSGGLFYLVAVAASAVVAMIRCFARRDESMNEVLIALVLWCAVSLVMTLSAQRFALLFLVPCAFLFAWGYEQAGQRLKQYWPSSWPAFTRGLAAVIAALLVLSWPVYQGQQRVSTVLNPIFNDAWDKALTKIKEETPQDAIINSWWPPGHFVKAIAERRVIFDGASIKSPQAYWLTHALLSSSEAEALGILRMLNTSGVKATEFLHEELEWPLSVAVPFLKLMANMPINQAHTLASAHMTDEQVQLLLRMTHASPPPVYLMVYNEMMQEPGIWAMFHKWDFKKMETLQTRPDLAARAPSKKSDEYRDFFWDLVGGMYRASAPLDLVRETENAWVFEQGLIINPETKQAIINSDQFGKGIPQSVFYASDTKVAERVMPKSTLGYSVVLFTKEGGAPQAMLMDRVLAESLLVKLYLFDGLGLKHFPLFDDTHDLTRQTVIKTFEVLW